MEGRFLQFPPFTNDYHAIALQKEAFHGQFTMGVSVVIPFYRGCQLLACTLASLLQQTYPLNLIEVIVSDDGSEESVLDVVERFKTQLNLRYVRQEHLGFRLATVRNLGIKCATNDVIISIDHDIICPPDFVAAHLRWFHVSDEVATIGLRKFISAQHISVETVMTDFASIAHLPTHKSISNDMNDIDDRTNLFDNFTQIIPSKCFHACNVAYRRSHALKIGGFDEKFNYNYGYEDLDFGHRLWLSGIFLVAESNALVYHLENDGVAYQEKLDGLRINRQKFYERFPELQNDALYPRLRYFRAYANAEKSEDSWNELRKLYQATKSSLNDDGDSIDCATR